jgi:MFS family permease
VGALIVALTSGWISRVHRHGRALTFAACAWGLAIGGVAFSPSIGVAIAMLVLAGTADMISGQFRMLIWNQTIPDSLRGRLAGIELLSYSVGPLTGQVTLSGIAALTSLRTALAIGSAVCTMSAAAIGRSIQSLWNFDDRTNVHAVAERHRRRGDSSIQQ